MNLTLAQLLTLASSFEPYEDEAGPLAPVTFERDPEGVTSVRATCDGVTYRVRPDGALVDAEGLTAHERQMGATS